MSMKSIGNKNGHTVLARWLVSRPLRVMILTLTIAGVFGAFVVKPPSAMAGGSPSDLGSNGQHRRPFYNFGHNPNTLGEISGDLNAGANALEPDVMRFADDTEAPGGRNINEQAGPSGLFMYHDHAFATRMPTTVEDWLDFVHGKVVAGSNVALIAFDIKTAAATSGRGMALLEAVRTHLNYGGVRVNVIFSVATRDDAAVLRDIIPHLGDREGVMIDSENDPGSVYNYLVGLGAAGHIGYGNGAAGVTYGTAPNVLNSIEAASSFRAGLGLALSIPYAFPIDLASDMHAFITAGADGLIPDKDILVPSSSQTQEHLQTLATIVNQDNDIYLATSAEDPFHPQVEAYGLKVDTRDVSGAGTDSKITFTLTGCNGTSSVTVRTDYINHMEAGGTNYVTLPSRDLGPLQSIKLSSDGSRGGPFDNSPWDPGRVEVSSARWGVPYGDHVGADFSGSRVKGDLSQTKALQGARSCTTIATAASPGNLLGAPVRDNATLSGGSSPTGSVTFRLFSDNTCSTQVFTSTNPLSGVTATSTWFTPPTVGTYYWTATYSGDATNNAATSPCGAPNESVVIAPFAPPPPTQTVTGDFTGPLTVNAGDSVLITGARVVGPVTVNPGGALTVVGSKISQGITADGPGFFSVCGSQVSGPSTTPGRGIAVSNATVPIRVGDPANGCAGNTVAGDLTLTSNLAVTLGANTVSGDVAVNTNGPGNTIVKAHKVYKALACTGNNPAPTNASQVNTAATKSGQCSTL